MTHHTVITTISGLEFVLACGAIGFILRAKQGRTYSLLCALLGVRAAANAIFLFTYMAMDRGSSTAYALFYYSYWSSYALEAIVTFGIIVSVYRLAMRPLQGLHNLGMLVFRWIAAVSVVVSVGLTLQSTSSAGLLESITSHVQRTQSVLTLCLLLFVTFALRPMGLAYTSRIFGVSLGLGIMATLQLLQSAWFFTSTSVAHRLTTLSGIATCATLLMWSLYFALPEPKRRMILLPTTSPFLRWNQISLALGSNPGFVAVGGVAPGMLASAEIEVMRRASRKMDDQVKPAAFVPALARTAGSSSRSSISAPQNIYPIRPAASMKIFSASSFL